MSIDRVTEGRHVAGERHAGSDVAPERARVVDSHLGLGDVRRDTEIRDPQVLQCQKESAERNGEWGEWEGGRGEQYNCCS